MNEKDSKLKYGTPFKAEEIDYQVAEEMWGTDNFLCPNCKDPLTSFWKTGKRKTKTRGNIDKFKCLKCFKSFIIKEVDFRLQHKKEIVELFKDLRNKKLSCYIIHRDKLLNIDIGLMTLYRWNKRFNLGLNQIHKNTESIKGAYING